MRVIRKLSNRPSGHSDRQVLAAVIGVSVVTRVAAALYFGNTVEVLPGVADQVSYHNLAVRVLEGHGFTFATGWWPATPAEEPTAHWSYLYVLFLSGVYGLFGTNALAGRLIQAVIVGILQPLLAWRIGRRLYGPRVGLVAAGITSLYAYFVYYSASLMTEGMFIVALMWAVDISMAMVDSQKKSGHRPHLRDYAFLGLSLGLTGLLRQTGLLLAPICLAWVALNWSSQPAVGVRGAGVRERVLGTSVAIAILSLCILPWSIRNYRAFGTFVLLNTNAGFAFFWGNHPIHGSSFVPILPGSGSRYGELIPDELRGLNEAELDKALLREGVHFVLSDPGRYLRLSLSRFSEFFKFWPSPESGTLSNISRVGSFGITFPFVLAGLILLLQRVKRQHPGVILVLVLCCAYSLIHLLTWALIRYRLPVDALTAPIAAFALVYFYERLFTKKLQQSPQLSGEVSY